MHTNEKISLTMLSVGVSLGLFAFGFFGAIPFVLIISNRIIWSF